jgi:TP901 family phage tail tape measure protein
MANNSTSRATIEVTTNTTKAKQDIEQLNTLLKKLQKTKQLMMKEGLAYDNDGKATATFKKLQQDIKSTTKAMKDNMSAQEKMKATLNDLSNLRLKDLKRRYRELSKELGNFTGQEKVAAAQWRNDLQKIQAQINSLEGTSKKFGTTQNAVWKTALRNITAYMGVFAAFNWIKSMVTGVAKANLELSDSLTDIRKVSGLTIQEVDQLQESLMKIDTRASVQELDKLAYAGAKLGMGNYGVAGLTSFVRAANKVNVALKEDLGEDALTAMSKLVEVMGLIPKLGIEKAMDAAGSAIFTLSTSSTATGKNIIEMSKRLMGLANVSHVTTAELLALSSASDTMGLMPEVSATAFNKMFTSIQTNTKAIEKALEMQQGTLKAMIDEGRTMDAIITVFDKMNKLGRMDAMKPLFKDLGSDGARLNAVMTTMASKVDILKDHIDMSNQSFKEATAIQKEYLMQQESAQGYMERATNVWTKAFVNPEGVNIMKELAIEWYNLSRTLTQNTAWMSTMIGSFKTLALIIETLVKLLPVLTTYLMMYGVARAAYGAVAAYNALKVSILAARTATVELTAAQKASGWGLLLTAIALGVSYFLEYGDAAMKATDSQQKFNEATAEAQKIHEKQNKKLDEYKKKLEDTSLTEEARTKIIDKFNREFGTYLDKLGIEIKTVDDLKTHYAALNEELRKKAYYEQGERLRQDYVGDSEQRQTEAMGKLMTLAQKYGFSDDIIASITYGSNAFTDPAYFLQRIYNEMYGKQYGTNGKLNWSKKNPYQYTVGEGNTRSTKPMQFGGNDKTEEIYNAILDIVGASREVYQRTRQVEDYMKKYADGYQPMNYGYEPLAGDYTAPPTKKELADLQKAYRQELKDAVKQSNAIIDKIEEWYRLQETALNQMVTDGEISDEQMKHRLRELNIAKNNALATARRAIVTGDDTQWNKINKEIYSLAVDTGQWSKDLFNEILSVDLKANHDTIAKFDGSAAVLGVKSTADFDEISKNAAGNEREIAKIMRQMQTEVEEMLMKYNFFESVQNKFFDDLDRLGFMGESLEQMARRIQSGGAAPDKSKNRAAAASLMKSFQGLGANAYTVNPADAAAVAKVLKGMKGDWQEAFPQLTEWLDHPEMYKKQIEDFYSLLLITEGNYYKARKQMYQHYKQQNEQMWEESGRKEYYDQTYVSLQNRQKMQDVFGAGQTFGQQYGFADAIANDPEVELYKQKLQAAAEYYQFVESHQHTEQEMREAGQAVLESYLAMAQKVSNEVAERAKKIQELEAPATEFAEAVGQKWGDMMFDMESSQQTWNEIVKKMILGFAQMTIKMTAENLTKKIQMALFYKQMQAMEIEHQTTMLGIQTAFGTMQLGAQKAIDTSMQVQKSADDAQTVSKEVSLATILTSLGISEGAAKIIGKLGWWGIPLVAVISSLLMGLLSSALSTASKSSSSSSTSSNSNATKIKLVSGMLTYDEGNSYVGSDGHVYSARAAALPSGVGMVTSPIATTVNGQPSLVAEKGPELVIGRRATRHIQMNEPGLLHHLASLNGRFMTHRPYDEGNVAALSSDDIMSSPNNDMSSASIDALASVVAELSATVQALQKKGVPAYINKYGPGGIVEEVKSGLKFDAKYSG